MTIAMLAAVVGVDTAYLGEVERGQANISVIPLGMSGRALGVGAAAMLDGEPRFSGARGADDQHKAKSALSWRHRRRHT